MTGKQLARNAEGVREQPRRGRDVVVTHGVTQRDAGRAKLLKLKALIKRGLRHECVRNRAHDAGRGQPNLQDQAGG